MLVVIIPCNLGSPNPPMEASVSYHVCSLEKIAGLVPEPTPTKYVKYRTKSLE